LEKGLAEEDNATIPRIGKIKKLFELKHFYFKVVL